jgi:asparagine synthase (glutamine-hydrolysing)
MAASPWPALDGQLAVVFNGAIYNFGDLREELRSRGFIFKSATDTEVLLHGYQAWGMTEMVKRLRGMFAFALWDRRVGKLFLVRDRLGVKPWYTPRAGARSLSPPRLELCIAAGLPAL